MVKSIVGKVGGGIMPLAEILINFLGRSTSNHTHTGCKGGTCHGFIVINPDIQEQHDAPKAEDIYSRRKGVFAYADRMKNGINVNINTVAEKNLCDYLQMDSVKYLGVVDLSSAKKSRINSLSLLRNFLHAI